MGYQGIKISSYGRVEDEIKQQVIKTNGTANNNTYPTRKNTETNKRIIKITGGNRYENLTKK